MERIESSVEPKIIAVRHFLKRREKQQALLGLFAYPKSSKDIADQKALLEKRVVQKTLYEPNVSKCIVPRF